MANVYRPGVTAASMAGRPLHGDNADQTGVC